MFARSRAFASAAGVPARTWELSQFLTGVLGVNDVGSTYEGTWHTTRPATPSGSCASCDAPLSLLRAVPGVELVELPDAEECCGFGGTFAVKNADVSAAMLDEKLAAVVAQVARAAVCACDKLGARCTSAAASTVVASTVRPVHLAEILAS